MSTHCRWDCAALFESSAISPLIFFSDWSTLETIIRAFLCCIPLRVVFTNQDKTHVLKLVLLKKKITMFFYFCLWPPTAPGSLVCAAASHPWWTPEVDAIYFCSWCNWSAWRLCRALMLLSCLQCAVMSSSVMSVQSLSQMVARWVCVHWHHPALLLDNERHTEQTVK